MKKHISKEKLSKKEKRRLNAESRRDWGGISPVTKRVENKKAYNRKNARSWHCDDSPGVFLSWSYCEA